MPDEELYYLGVKGLVQNTQGQVLILKIQKDDRTYFDLPGGRVNRDESILDALARELQEETGINSMSPLSLLAMAPTSIQIPITSTVNGGLILAIYACDAAIPDSFQTSPTMQPLWCDRNDVAARLTDYPTELHSAIAQHLNSVPRPNL